MNTHILNDMEIGLCFKKTPKMFMDLCSVSGQIEDTLMGTIFL